MGYKSKGESEHWSVELIEIGPGPGAAEPFLGVGGQDARRHRCRSVCLKGTRLLRQTESPFRPVVFILLIS